MPLIAEESCINNNNLSVNFTMTAGETASTQLTISSGGAPYNLTGYTVKMQINSPTPIDLNTGNGGITLVTPASGIIQINITDAESDAYSIGTFSYDMWIISGDASTVYRILGGNFTILEGVTPVP